MALTYHLVFEKDESLVQLDINGKLPVSFRPYNHANKLLGMYIVGTEAGDMNPNPSDQSRLIKLIGLLPSKVK